jgi:AraC-like DNA-binding protein
VQLSPFHLLRVFRAAVGLPPHAYQIQLRVARAKELLRAGMPIAAVAVEVGFVDQSHLTRHFKRLVGVPPGRYRVRRG